MLSATEERIVVFAVEFTCTPHVGHGMHRLEAIGEFPSYEAAREAIQMRRQEREANGAASKSYLGFMFWPSSCSEHLPPHEMWLDLNDQAPVAV